jgi:hypothetical protein
MAYEFAAPPFDVAIARVERLTMSCFLLTDSSTVWLWQDVYAAGYAESAISRDHLMVRPDIRGLKGYVVRKLPAGSILTQPHPEAFELDFAVPHCMSGSPLVLRYMQSEPRPDGEPFRLIGICVGNQMVEIGEMREEYGVAHDLWSMRDWRPELLDGGSLAEAITVS